MSRWRVVKLRRWVAIGVLAAPVLAAALVGYFRWWGNQVDQAISRTVAGRRILIDPGHGGIDPGVVRGKIEEKDINLAISLQLKKLLQEAGMAVLLTRETDTDLCYSKDEEEIGRHKKMDLKSRVFVAESFGAEVYLGIHANSSSITGCKGPQTFYNSASNPDGGRLARLIQEEMVKVSPTTREAADVTNQYMLKTLKVPAVTVEVGFVSNGQDASRLTDPRYQRRMAWAIFSGTVRFFAEVPEERPSSDDGR
ncbi:MAG: N-acetylmuramoyl-L-alanine amidase [Bacillota bacterium]